MTSMWLALWSLETALQGSPTANPADGTLLQPVKKHYAHHTLMQSYKACGCFLPKEQTVPYSRGSTSTVSRRIKPSQVFFTMEAYSINNSHFPRHAICYTAKQFCLSALGTLPDQSVPAPLPDNYGEVPWKQAYTGKLFFTCTSYICNPKN